jgi:electron transfer flavoprotein alpha subunit
MPILIEGKMTEKIKIVVVGELAEGGLSAQTMEILGCARGLADRLSGEVEAVLLGEKASDYAGNAISHGADRVVVAQNSLLRDFNPQAWLPVLESHLKSDEAYAVLFSHSAVGKDLGPCLAQRLGTGIAMDCVEMDVDADSKRIRMTRPVFGGKAMAVMVCPTSPQIATIRAKSMKAIEAGQSRTGEVIDLSPELNEGSLKVRIVEKIMEERDGVPLDEATVVISGGRGMGGAEGFDILEDLAKLLKGAVGSSRPPCDNGWMPASKQVGLTGKIIRPELYIAVALSGTSQHMAGCKDSGTIIAINKDPDAQIFSYAHYGVADDYKKVLPHLLEALKEKIE